MTATGNGEKSIETLRERLANCSGELLFIANCATGETLYRAINRIDGAIELIDSYLADLNPVERMKFEEKFSRGL